MIYVVVVYFIILFLWTIKKKFWGISVFMVALYLFSLSFSIALFLKEFQRITPGIVPSVIFCVALTLLFSPYFIKRPIIKAPSAREITAIVRVFSTISISFIIADIFIYPAISAAIIINANDIRSEGAQTFYTMFTGYKAYIYYYISSFYILSYLLLFMFFYSIAFIKNRIWYKIILLVASLSAPYLGILDGGRTNITFWVLSAIIAIILFKPYFKKGKKVKTYFLIAIPTILLASMFIMVSVDRFEYSDEGTQGWLIIYSGQPFLYFCDFIDNFHSPTYSLQRILPRLSTFFYGDFDLGMYRDYVRQTSHMSIGIFYTLLGDLYVDVGIVGMFIYVFIYKWICKVSFKRTTFGIEEIILLSLLIQIPTHGLFYYSLWTIKASNAIIVTILLYFYFKRFRVNKTFV